MRVELMEFEYQRRSQSERSKDRDRRKEIWDRSGTVALWIAAGVGLLAIAASCVDSRHQLSVIDTQVKIMRAQIDEMRAEQRPWISYGVNSEVISVSLDEVNKELKVTMMFTLQNSGKNPASFVYVDAQAHIGAVALPFGSMRAWESSVCDQSSGPLGLSIFPNSFEPTFSVDANTPQGELEKLAALQKRIGNDMWVVPTVATCITYRDAVTGLRHYTPAVFQIFRRTATGNGGISAISLRSLPLGPKDLVARLWMLGTLPPD